MVKKISKKKVEERGARVSKTPAAKTRITRRTKAKITTSPHESEDSIDSDSSSVHSQTTCNKDNRSPFSKKHKKNLGAHVPQADNDNIRIFEKVTFLNVSIQVKPSTRAVEEVAARLATLLQILKDADSSVGILPYKPSCKLEFGGRISLDKEEVIDNVRDIPTTMTLLKKYLRDCRPNNKGGTVYGFLRIGTEDDFKMLLDDVEYELSKEGIKIYFQSLQHHDVFTTGWLHYFNQECDINFWTEWFSNKLSAELKREVRIGLRNKNCYTGPNTSNKSQAPYQPRHYRFQKAIHFEVIREERNIVTSALKKILKSADFESVYGIRVRLVPIYGRHNPPSVNVKIQRLFLQHKNAMKCLNNATISNIDVIDSAESSSGKTLRQMVLELKNRAGERLFTSIDLSWNQSGYTLFWPLKYNEEGLTAVSHLSATLHKTHGDCVRKLLSEEENKKIDTTTWVEGIPYTKDDEELDELFNNSESLAWFDLSLLKENEETNAPENSIPQNSVPLQLFNDDDTVSTFQRNLQSGQKSSTAQTRCSEDTSLTHQTVESRISVMEQSIQSIQKDFLEKFTEMMDLMKTNSASNTAQEQQHDPNSSLLGSRTSNPGTQDISYVDIENAGEQSSASLE